MAYIEDTNLIEEIKSLKISLGGKDIFPDEAKKSVLRVISEQPTPDVVEVVRCKDCKHCNVYISSGGIHTWQCVRSITWVKADHFCSWGERRTE